MRPIPLDERDVERILIRHANPNFERVVMGAPNGDLLDDDIRPIEAMVWSGTIGRMFGIVIELEDGDLLKLQANGGKLLLTTIGGVAPFDLEVLE